jgi:hypothetical protein
MAKSNTMEFKMSKSSVIISYNGNTYMWFRADQAWYPKDDDVLFIRVDADTAKTLKAIALDLGYRDTVFDPPPPPPLHLIETRRKRLSDKPEKVKKPAKEKSAKQNNKGTSKVSIKLFE